MSLNYDESLSTGLVDEIHSVIMKYSEAMLVSTVVGCLEIVKMQILEDYFYGEPDGEEEQN